MSAQQSRAAYQGVDLADPIDVAPAPTPEVKAALVTYYAWGDAGTENLASALESMPTHVERMAAVLAPYQRRIAELGRDAERLEYLRTHGFLGAMNTARSGFIEVGATLDALRANIDADIAAEREAVEYDAARAAGAA